MGGGAAFEASGIQNILWELRHWCLPPSSACMSVKQEDSIRRCVRSLPSPPADHSSVLWAVRVPGLPGSQQQEGEGASFLFLAVSGEGFPSKGQSNSQGAKSGPLNECLHLLEGAGGVP